MEVMEKILDGSGTVSNGSNPLPPAIEAPLKWGVFVYFNRVEGSRISSILME